MTTAIRTRRRDDAKRELRLYLALAACCFGLYALFLTVLPSWATRHGSTTEQAGVLVAVVAATGLLGDVLVTRLSARLGHRKVILIGIVLASLGSIVLVGATVFAAFVLASVFVGLAIAMLMSPILSGLSSRAGKSQITAQSVNAGWQRFGALMTSLFLLNVLSGANTVLVVIAMNLLVSALLVLTLLLAPGGPRGCEEPTTAAAPPFETLRLIRDRPLLRGGLVVNASTGVLVMVGASFFPLVLVALHKPHLLMAGLVTRELIAVGAALGACCWMSRRGLRRFWAVATVVGAVGLSTFPFVSYDPLLVVAFALHGAAVGAGIVLGNVLIYDGTTRATRTRGFAASAMAGRVVTIVIPLVLGIALAASSGFAMITAALIALTAVLLYSAVGRAVAPGT